MIGRLPAACLMKFERLFLTPLDRENGKSVGVRLEQQLAAILRIKQIVVGLDGAGRDQRCCCRRSACRSGRSRSSRLSNIRRIGSTPNTCVIRIRTRANPRSNSSGRKATFGSMMSTLMAAALRVSTISRSMAGPGKILKASTAIPGYFSLNLAATFLCRPTSSAVQRTTLPSFLAAS